MKKRSASGRIFGIRLWFGLNFVSRRHTQTHADGKDSGCRVGTRREDADECYPIVGVECLLVGAEFISASSIAPIVVLGGDKPRRYDV